MDELNFGFQIIEGNKPILIVAGHNFNHGRDGKIKLADLGTGDIVRNLCQKYNFYGLVSTRPQLDPNWYFSSNFREKIREIVASNKIELIIDIHGSGMQNLDLVYLRFNKKFDEKYPNLLTNFKIKEFVKNNQLTISEEFGDFIPSVEIEIREDGRVDTIDIEKYLEAQEKINQIILTLI